MGKKAAAAKRFLAVTQSLFFFGRPASYYPLLEATSSLMCCHVEKRSRSEMPRRDHLLSNARAVSLLRRRLQKPCKQRVKACEKKGSHPDWNRIPKSLIRFQKGAESWSNDFPTLCGAKLKRPSYYQHCLHM